MKGFLRDCQRVEALAAEIYERLARDSSYPAWLSAAFRQLAADEREHAQHIDMVTHASEETLDGLPALSGKVIEDTVRLAERMAARLDRGPVDAEQALRLAVQMEEQFSLVHVEQSVFSYNPGIAKLFAKLRSEDGIHLERLRKNLERWRSERGAG